MRRIRGTMLMAFSTVIVAVIIVASTINIKATSATHSLNLFYKNATPEDQEHLLLANEIQGGIAYEPYVAYMVDQGWGKVLLRSSEIWPGHPNYVLLLDRNWASSHPDLAARIVRAHIDAELWIQNALANPNSSEYSYLISKGMQISNKSATVVEDALKDIEFSYNLTNTTKNYVKMYTDGYIEEGLVSNQSLLNMSYQSSEEFASSYIDTNYISMALNVTPTDTILGNISMGFVKGNIFMLPTFIALDKSLWGEKTAFEKYGIEAALPEPLGFNTGALVTHAFLVGDIDVGFTAICPAILMHLNNKMNTIVVAQMTANGTALVVQNGINSLEDLSGKTIASVDPVTIQNIFMMYVAKENGFQLIHIN